MHGRKDKGGKMDRRKCTINGRKAWIHMFYVENYVVAPSLLIDGDAGGQISVPRAIVEIAEDGRVEKCCVTDIKFEEWEED